MGTTLLHLSEVRLAIIGLISESLNGIVINTHFLFLTEQKEINKSERIFLLQQYTPAVCSHSSPDIVAFLLPTRPDVDHLEGELALPVCDLDLGEV